MERIPGDASGTPLWGIVDPASTRRSGGGEERSSGRPGPRMLMPNGPQRVAKRAVLSPHSRAPRFPQPPVAACLRQRRRRLISDEVFANGAVAARSVAATGNEDCAASTRAGACDHDRRRTVLVVGAPSSPSRRRGNVVPGSPTARLSASQSAVTQASATHQPATNATIGRRERLRRRLREVRRRRRWVGASAPGR
jgi:hypothetical protein